MKTFRELHEIAVVPIETGIHRGNNMEFLSDTSLPPIDYFHPQ